MLENFQNAPTFVLAHLSDPHLTDLTNVRLRDLANKRVLGYISWLLRRRHIHRTHVLAALVRDLNGIQHHHVAITGDLTHLGLPSEFEQAQSFLKNLGPPEQVTVVPGNHDAYVSTRWEETWANWQAYSRADSIKTENVASAESPSEYPILRVRGCIAMIGVSTAVPSRPFLATGRIGNRQLQGLSALLESTARRGLFRIVLIHHPPVSGVIGRRKRLTDAEAFQSIVADKGAELILHGHAHKNSLTHLQTPTGEVPVFGIPSASAAERRSDHLARYHLYHIRPDNRHWDVRVIKRGWSPTSGGFEPNGMLSFVLARLSAQ